MRRFGARKVWLGGGVLALIGGVSVAAGPAIPGADMPAVAVAELGEPAEARAVAPAEAGAVAPAVVVAEAGAVAPTVVAAEAGSSAVPAREAMSPEAVLETQVGSASYYANMLAGRRTASGIRYDPSAAVAAHRELPFGTRLRVHNLANGRTVEVEVVDRGPFAKGRILDLSRSAAEELGFIRAGHTRVRIEVLEYGGRGG